MIATKNFDEADIKVLMLGASRVGKTSILASLASDESIALAKEGTNLEVSRRAGNGWNTVMNAEHIMRKYFSQERIDEYKAGAGEFELNDGATAQSFDCLLDVGVQSAKKTAHSIGFTDIPGEWVNNFASGGLNDTTKKTLGDMVEKADVIIIAIDSVLLMENDGENAENGNKINTVTALLKTYCSSTTGNNNKLFLFVPVKCELYYYIHRDYAVAKNGLHEYDYMEKLIGRVETAYASLMDWLTGKDAKSQHNSSVFSVAILPVLTMGMIEFAYFGSGESGLRTAKDMIFEFVQYFDKDNKQLPIEYSPRFCEQILLYILVFELRKVEKLSKNVAVKLLGWLKSIFGGFASDTKLMAELSNLQKHITRMYDLDSDKGTLSLIKIVQDPLKCLG